MLSINEAGSRIVSPLDIVSSNKYFIFRQNKHKRPRQQPTGTYVTKMIRSLGENIAARTLQLYKDTTL